MFNSEAFARMSLLRHDGVLLGDDRALQNLGFIPVDANDFKSPGFSAQVSVPVLSNAISVTSELFNRFPAFARMPCFASVPIPATIATGIEMTMAPGQAMTSKVSAKDKLRESIRAAMASKTTNGVYHAANASIVRCVSAFFVLYFFKSFDDIPEDKSIPYVFGFNFDQRQFEGWWMHRRNPRLISRPARALP